MSDTRNICNYLTQKAKDVLGLKPDEARKLILPVTVFAIGGTVVSIPSAAIAIFTYSTLPSNVFAAIIMGSALGVGHIAYGRKNNEQLDVKSELEERKNYASLVKIKDDISAELSDKLIPVLRKAFADPDSKGVVLKINSEGGAPVPTSNIYKEILKLKKQYSKKVVAVGEDYLKGGAYQIACSADVIYVNENTETGSIGVISRQIGVAELAQKIGVKARTQFSGPYKNRSDPLLNEETKEDQDKVDKRLKLLHEKFITTVKTSREGKLESEEVSFSGDTWSGEEALKMGLVDKLGSYTDVLENEFFVDKPKEYGPSSFEKFFKKFFNISIEPKVDFSLDKFRM